jgi:hypothetical protein
MMREGHESGAARSGGRAPGGGVKSSSITKVSRERNRVQRSPLAAAVREAVCNYVRDRQYFRLGVDAVLRQFDGGLAPMVLDALDSLAAAGVIRFDVDRIGGIIIVWCGRKEVAA